MARIAVDDLHSTTDAMEWAETFCDLFQGRVVRIFDGPDNRYVDPGLMVGWFANAMAAQEMSTPTELAWAAGLFDGEGSIKSHRRRNGYTAITMAVAMCDEGAVRRFHRAVEVGKTIELKRLTNAGRRVWRWSVCADQNVSIVVEKLRPYMCSSKLKDAELALLRRAQAKGLLTYGKKESHG